MFSQELKVTAKPIMDAILAHPFVQGLKNGQLSQEALTFYVSQDHQYLKDFVHIYANAITRSTDTDMIRFFNEGIDFLTNQESQAHLVLCQAAGVSYDDLKHAIPSPKAYLYESHMYRAGLTGSLLNIMAAFQPCPWTYAVIGETLAAQGANNSDNPFKGWIDFYAENTETNDIVMGYLDRLAKEATPEERAVASQYFVKSCELEWQFWEQAYYQENWHFQSIIEKAGQVQS